MLTNVTEQLAYNTAPKIFEKVATHVCDIIRPGETSTGYGGSDPTDADLLTDIKCVYKATPASAKYQLGKEYLSGRIQFPRTKDGEPIDLQLTDKIRIQPNSIAEYARIFQVRDINPNYDAFYDVGVLQEEGNA